MTFIKICGITNSEDAHEAFALGADALGFNFYKPSPRYITPERARDIIASLPESVMSVGVFVNESREVIKTIVDETAISTVQLHGDESPAFCLGVDHAVFKSLAASHEFDLQTASEYEVEAFILDTEDKTLRGGTGRVFDWAMARQFKSLKPKLILAGGLSPENVREAIKLVRPYGVDVCSSLEDAPGKKSHARMRAFVEQVRNVEA